MIFVTAQMVYVVAVLTQIIGFFVVLSRVDKVDGIVLSVDEPNYLLNTCLSPETTHWADWCTNGMLPGGFFFTSIHQESNVLVVFFMALILLLAAPFTFGLVTLWLVQMRNFCTGMTTMERMGSLNNRRNYSYVEQVRETMEEEEDDNYTESANP